MIKTAPLRLQLFLGMGLSLMPRHTRFGVQVSDEENASLEGNFTVVLTNDVHEDSDGDGFSDVLEKVHLPERSSSIQASSNSGLNFGLVVISLNHPGRKSWD